MLELMLTVLGFFVGLLFLVTATVHTLIMMSNCESDEDIIAGLNLGADNQKMEISTRQQER